jgi:dienelactone hydrolase
MPMTNAPNARPSRLNGAPPSPAALRSRPVALLAAALLVLSALLFAPAAPASDVATSYARAVVYAPGHDSPIVPGAIAAALKPGARHPAVLFMHGCGGIGRPDQDAHLWAKLIAAAGYVAILPDSLARSDRPLSCDPATRKAGLFPGVYEMRREEIVLAANLIRMAPWFDGKAMILMGYSEGAVVAVNSPFDNFTGIIATSWTCNLAGFPALHGIKLPAKVPLLTLVHEADPWFRNAIFKGSCADHFAGRPDARHVTVPGEGHGTYKSEAARKAVGDFLARFRNGG